MKTRVADWKVALLLCIAACAVPLLYLVVVGALSKLTDGSWAVSDVPLWRILAGHGSSVFIASLAAHRVVGRSLTSLLCTWVAWAAAIGFIGIGAIRPAVSVVVISLLAWTFAVFTVVPLRTSEVKRLRG